MGISLDKGWYFSLDNVQKLKMKSESKGETRWAPISRIGIHKVALTFLEEFGWIEREQPISDYGIDMHIEIAIDGNPTGQLIGLQIKTGPSYFSVKKKDSYVFNKGEKRHLDYWLDQAIPVLLIICNPETDCILWVHVERSKIVESPKGWRIEIPKANVLVNSKQQIFQIYHDSRGFTLLDENDFSHPGARRIKALYRVDKHFCLSRVVMRNMIPTLVEIHRASQLHNNERMKAHFGNRNADIVILFFYSSVLQENHGLPFCIARWTNPQLPNNHRMVESEASETIDGIKVEWNNSNYFLETLMQENRVSKAAFLQLVDDTKDELLRYQKELSRLYSEHCFVKDLERLRDSISKIEPLISKCEHSIGQFGFPPEYCATAKKELSNAGQELYSIVLFVKSPHLDFSYMRECISKALDQFNIAIEKFQAHRSRL